jgi:hypothetical protein
MVVLFDMISALEGTGFASPPSKKWVKLQMPHNLDRRRGFIKP